MVEKRGGGGAGKQGAGSATRIASQVNKGLALPK